jgi:hypothetical protein
MSDFQVTLKVNGSRLATVLEALKGAAELLSVLPCEEAPSRASRSSGYVGGKRNKGVYGRALALAALRRAAPGSMTIAQIVKIFVERGFSPNLPSPALAELKVKGLVELTEPGRYRITEKGKEEQI